MKSLAVMKSAQSSLEYSLFIGVIAAALAAMGIYMSRSVKANLKMVENQVNEGVKVRPLNTPSNEPYLYMKQDCFDLCPPQPDDPYGYCDNSCEMLYTIFTGGCLGSHCDSLSGGEKTECINYCLGKWDTASHCVASCPSNNNYSGCAGVCIDAATDWPWTVAPPNTGPTVPPEVTTNCWEQCANVEDVATCMATCTGGY